jgi:CheY-like chemotaxis protein
MAVDEAMPVLIAMSGNVGESYQQEYFDNGFDYFVPKPIDFKVLKSILDSITNNLNRS